MEYSQYSERIPCEVGDKVYVYRKRDFVKTGTINENMVGTIEFLDQQTDEAWDGMQYLTYTVVIKLSDDTRITIKDDGTRPILRKYEFITLSDLKEKYNIEIAY